MLLTAAAGASSPPRTQCSAVAVTQLGPAGGQRGTKAERQLRGVSKDAASAQRQSAAGSLERRVAPQSAGRSVRAAPGSAGHCRCGADGDRRCPLRKGRDSS